MYWPLRFCLNLIKNQTKQAVWRLHRRLQILILTVLGEFDRKFYSWLIHDYLKKKKKTKNNYSSKTAAILTYITQLSLFSVHEEWGWV